MLPFQRQIVSAILSLFAAVSTVNAQSTCSAGGTQVTNARVERASTIVDVASEAGTFNTLLAAAKAAGLAEVLSGPGPFTVFAPTDEAFAKIDKGAIESLLQPENRDTLAAILKYHVVSGRVLARQAIGAGEAATLQGEKVEFAIDGGQLKVNDAAVVANDIIASNGVVHVIDTVLMPEELPSADRGRRVIGVYVERPGAALASQLGVDRNGSLVVTGLVSGSGAEQAGLEQFDVVIGINGRTASRAELDRAKGAVRPGQSLRLEILRKGERQTVSVPVMLARH